jgi:hypothetical protein
MKIKHRKFLKNGNVVAIDSKYTGEEPEWKNVTTQEEFDRKFSAALNFYNYYLDRDDYFPIISEYMVRNQFDTKDIALIKHVPKTAGNVTSTGKMCRMFNMGMPKELSWDYEERTASAISLLVSAAEVAKAAKAPKVEDPNAKPKPNVHEIMKNKVREKILCELELMLDDWCTFEPKVTKFPLAAVMRGENIPVSATREVKEWLTKQRNEYNEAFEKTCPDMVEGYSYLSKPALRNRIKACDAMLNELVLYKTSKASARKPRTKKPKAADKQVQKMKYLSESKDHSMQSCDPTRIIGANMFFAFNTKYRKLTVFKARTRDGFTVSGTSIKDFDEDNSFSLTLRKPEDYLPIIASKTEKQIEKSLNELKTKRKSANGRINQDTILVRAL